jgi:Protein of unknown function (DUF4242)
MPRYLIERTYEVDEEGMPEVSRRSKSIAIEHFPRIVWEHSHVVVDRDGTPMSFCVYGAPTEELVRRHADQLGDHEVVAVYEIAGDVTPDDFPLDDD